MAYTDYSRVRIESDGRVLTAIIDNPPLNLITRELLDELGELTAELAADPEPLVLVLKSADPDFFIPHAEFANLYSMQIGEIPASSAEVSPNSIHRICERLRAIDKISIAQVEGRAGGGGAALVMACDMRFGAIGKAIFNNMAVPLGTVPGGGASQYMPRLVGRSRALELILGGIDLDAVTAERWGYLNRALPADQIETFVAATARRIAASSPEAVRMTKALVDAAEHPLEDGLREESFGFQRLMASEGSLANIRTFLSLGGETRDGEKRLGEVLTEVIRTSGPEVR
jgi:enoyl-CoA hydratase/carnithine racemase